MGHFGLMKWHPHYAIWDAQPVGFQVRAEPRIGRATARWQEYRRATICRTERNGVVMDIVPGYVFPLFSLYFPTLYARTNRFTAPSLGELLWRPSDSGFLHIMQYTTKLLACHSFSTGLSIN